MVLPNLALVKPIEENERDVEGETSMGVGVLQELAIEPPNGWASRSISSPSGDIVPVRGHRPRQGIPLGTVAAAEPAKLLLNLLRISGEAAAG